MKNRTKIIMAGLVLAFSACTDLEVEEKDSRLTEAAGEFAGVDPTSALVTSYNDLRGFGDQANLFALLEVTSDEMLVPTRGTDWGDNGVWRTLHQHTWDATHAQVLATWNNLNSNVYRTNQLLHPKSGANAGQIAEAKFLRAYNMFLVLDLYRQIPFRTPDDGVDVDPEVLTPEESIAFIEQDLNDALAGLPDVGPAGNTRQASQAAANFLLAKLYLNKHIYLGTEPQAADMTKVVQYVDAIKAKGFALYDGYFEMFESSPDSETIFWTNSSVGNRIWNGLHYFQTAPDNTGGGWNGFSTTADFYALFEGDANTNAPGAGQEERRGYVPEDGVGYGFLVGQQYGPTAWVDGEGTNVGPLKDRAGRPLIFTKDFPALSGNNESNGIRVIKYHPYKGAYAEHLILFRYADAHLMKIEAILRGGTSGDSPLALFNELREIRDASTFAELTLEDVLDERGRELYIEGWRRNDQVRFGTFDDTWAMKDVTEEFRIVFPIPENALSSNPNLVQNPGY